jgi:hypothetical protein
VNLGSYRTKQYIISCYLCNTDLMSILGLLATPYLWYIWVKNRCFKQSVNPKYILVYSGATAAVLKEKLLALGSSGILAEHQLQAQLQEQHLKG